MKNLALLEHGDHDRHTAIYAAQHDGKRRNFAYHEELGECRETFARLVQDVQQGAIGVILTPDASCLSIETSPGWMEAFIQAVKQHDILIGDHSHDLVYDLREEEDETQFRALYPQGEYEQARSAPRPLLAAIAQSPFAAAYLERRENWFLLTRLEGEDPRTAIYSLSSGAIGKDVDLFGLGRWKEMLDTLAPCGITEQEGWCPVSQERRDWLVRTQRQEDAMAEQTTAAMKPHRGSLPTGAHVRVILPGNGKARGKRRRKRGGEDGVRERYYLGHEAYQLTKVSLAREDVPTEALVLLAAWIEGEGLLVDERAEVGGIDFCRMDSKVMAPLPHIFTSFFARRPYKRKAGHSPRWSGFYLLYRDVAQGWKLLQVRGDTSQAEFIPLLAAHVRAVEEIQRRLGSDPGDHQESIGP